MRDLKNDGQISVHGDFNVFDYSKNEYKPLIECSNEELFLERPLRQENIRYEQAKKVKRLKPFYALSAILFFAAAGWAMINGKTDLASFIMGGQCLALEGGWVANGWAVSSVGGRVGGKWVGSV